MEKNRNKEKTFERKRYNEKFQKEKIEKNRYKKKISKLPPPTEK